MYMYVHVCIVCEQFYSFIVEYVLPLYVHVQYMSMQYIQYMVDVSGQCECPI